MHHHHHDLESTCKQSSRHNKINNSYKFLWHMVDLVVLSLECFLFLDFFIQTTGDWMVYLVP